MSQVAKSASALERAFLAILVLELEAMMVRLIRPLKPAGVHGYRWKVVWFFVDEVRLHQGLPASLPRATSKVRPLSSRENPSSPFSSNVHPLIGLCAKAWLILSI
jgi:hypothetical protein